MGNIRAAISFTLILGSLLTAPLRADNTSSVTEAKEKLQRQIDLLDSIRPYVERPDLGRLFLLREASHRVLDSIEKNGPLHLATMREYQNLIVIYRYSSVYLKEITTEATAPAIKEVGDLAEAFAKDYGFDDSPYTQITYNVFSQMHRLIQQLLQMNLSAELKTKLEGLSAPIGEMMAIAKGGDDYVTFKESVSRAQKIKELYSLFYQVASSDAAFYLVYEIQGLNEWYIGRARIPVKP